MPRGTKKIDKLAKEAQARSDAYTSGEGFQRGLYLKDGQTARGRFCEEGTDVWFLYTHPLPKKPGQPYEDKVLCLDQPFSEAEEANFIEGHIDCRGCEIEEISRTTRIVINFIRYDEPKLVRDEKNKPKKDAQGKYITDGVEPALVVCSFPTSTGGRISFLESQYGPLSKHVCTIHKTGDTTNPFMIDVVAKDLAPDHPDVLAMAMANDPFEYALHEKKISPPKAITSLSPRFMSIPLMSYGAMRRAYDGVSVASSFQGGEGSSGSQQSDNVYERAIAGGHINPGAFGS